MAGVVGEFVAGAALLPRGLGLIARRPRLFGLGAIPPAITSVIFIAVLVVVILQLERIVEWLTPFADAWSPNLSNTIDVLVGVALIGGLVLVMVISFTVLTLAERRAAMRKHRARVLGFAVPTFLLLAIPFVGVLVFPIATAAGTLLARQLLGEPT
ncbi:MAG TPA: EI24 domain-containing protein [Propionibacteriaceae bacterium]|nr:EI24 domain-containing protein [Propionibacteriaceae bacterium]